MNMNWPAVNSDIAEGVSSIGMAPAFDAYGAKGDGTTDDTVAMQAAIDANAGKIICGAPGKTYLITAPLYLPTGTKCHGNGATITIPVTPTTTITGMIIVGSKGATNGVPAGDELRATDVEISGWRFFSPTGGKGQAGIIFQPGSERVWIHHNHFEADYYMYQGKLASPSITAIFLSKKRLRDITIDSNTFWRIGRFILVRGAEYFTGTPYLYDVKGSGTTDVTETFVGSFGPAAPGTTYFMVPTTPADGTSVSPLTLMKPPYNWRWGVTITHVNHNRDSYRLYDAFDGGNDMTFNGVDRVTIASHIGPLPTANPTDPDDIWYTRFFVWNPATDPANDVVGLTITNNSGSNTTAGTIAVFCQITVARKGAIPTVDGLRNIIIDGNRFEFTYIPTGNIQNYSFGEDEDPALTNFALWSEDFTNAVWTRTGLATPQPGFWGPHYDTSRPAASRLFESAIGGAHNISNAITLSNATNPWTASIFLQAGTRSTVRLTWTTTANVGGYIDVDLSSGVITGTGTVGGGTLNFYGVIPYGDDWYRVYLDCGILSSTARYTLALTNGTGVTSYTGNANNYVQAYGLQVEQQVPVGNIFYIRNNTPSAYKPTHELPAKEISTTVISINGTIGFAVTNNIISASAGQGIHVEDGSSYGVIANNVISECTFGIAIMTCHDVSVINNTISRFYKTGITVRGGAPTIKNYDPGQWVDFQGSISDTTLTVTAITNYPNDNLLPNNIGVYKTLVSPGNYTGEVKPGTIILNQLTGTAGGIGTYLVSISQTVTLPTPMGKTILSASYGGQVENSLVSGNVIDAAGFPSVQAAYWIEAAFDPFRVQIDNPPALGLNSIQPLPKPPEYYYLSDAGHATPPAVVFPIVPDGVWHPTSGATVALGNNTVTVAGEHFVANDVGKIFTMTRGGSPVYFAGATVNNPGTGYRADDTITVSGTTAKVWSVTAISAALTNGGSGGPPNTTFIVNGNFGGRRGTRDSARLSVTTNSSGVVTTINYIAKGGAYTNPAFDGVNAAFYIKDYPGFTGFTATLTLGVWEIRRRASCYYGRIGVSGLNSRLTVTEMVYGTIAVGDSLSGIEVKEGTTITSQISGTTGGVGAYAISQGHSDMANNEFLFVSETPTTTTSPPAGNVSPTGGTGTGLSIAPQWRGTPLVGTITKVLSPTQIQLNTTATSSVSGGGVGYCYGSDNGPSIQGALDAGHEVFLPEGVICHANPLVYNNKSRLIGRGSALGNDANTILAYVGPNQSRGKQLSGDTDILNSRIDGCVVGEFMLYGNNLIGIGYYHRGVTGSQIRPMSIRAHTYIGVQLTGGSVGGSVGNLYSTWVVREIDSPGFDTTGIYIGPGVLQTDTPDDVGVNDVCRSFFPYWQVDVDMEGFGRPIWYRCADSNSHGFCKTRGPGDLPGIEFASHDTNTTFARAINFSYVDPNSMRLRGGAYPSQVSVAFYNYLNGGSAASVDGTSEAQEAIDSDDLHVTTEFGARFFGISNGSTLTAPRLQPYRTTNRQTPRGNSWTLMPIIDSNTNVPGAVITDTGSYRVLAMTDANEVLRVIQPMNTVGVPTVLSTTSPTASISGGVNLIRAMIPSGNLLYIVSAAGTGSTYLNILDVSDPTAPTEVSETLIAPVNSAGQIQLAGSYLYISTVDNTQSIKIVDISDPWSPVVAATISTANGGVCGLAVAGNQLIVGTNLGGIFRIYNLATLPATPPQISTLTLTNVTQINQIVVRGKYAYVTEANNTDTNLGLQIIDISNPAAPTLIGSYDASLGLTGDFDCRGLAVSGRYAYTAVIEVGGAATVNLHVVDISNPAAPTIALNGVSPVVFPLAQTPANVGVPLVMNGDVISHPSIGGGNHVHRYSVANPLAPAIIEGIVLGGNGAAIVYNGNLLFAANTNTTNNLLIFQMIGLDQEAASFGTLQTDRARLNQLDVDRDVRINGSVSVGNHGLASKGMIAGSATATRVYTVATLPAGRVGMRAMVSDATSPTFLATVTGGGSVRSPVFWDDAGSAWKVG